MNASSGSAMPSSTTSESAPLSESARILDTFIAPTKTFSDLRRNPSWWSPWLLTAIVSLAFVYAMAHQVGFERITKNALVQSGKMDQFDKLAPDQRAKQMAAAVTITRYISWATPVVILIAYTIMAGVLLATFKFGASADITYKGSLAIIAYAGLPGIIGALLGILSLFAGVDPEGFNPKNPVASNPAYFMDPAQSNLLYSLASALDVFVIWTIVLMGIGFACNSKVKRPTAILIVAGWYVLYKLVGGALGSV